jgi:hypothetical protein
MQQFHVTACKVIVRHPGPATHPRRISYGKDDNEPANLLHLTEAGVVNVD